MTDPFARFYNTGTWGTLCLNVVCGIALLGASAWFVNNLLSTRDADTPPRIVGAITIEPSILLPGKQFTAHIGVTLNRLCPYEVHWSLVRRSDNVEVAKIIEPVKQPPANLGLQELIVTRYIPLSVLPGDYQYISEVFDLCPNGQTYTSVRRHADITIR